MTRSTPMAIHHIALSVEIPLEKDGLPRDVRLLRAGENDSARGTFLFDDVAAQTVMATWKEHARGLDHPGMIDLEHLSLDPVAPNFDPDARAWYTLELRDAEVPRPNATKDLWLAELSWTPDGESRVAEKRQRFLSPTMYFDTETRRIRRVVNVGLTALPELHGAPQLIAARAALGEDTMADGTDSAAQMGAVLKALGLDPRMVDKVAIALGLEAGATLDDIRAAIDSFAAKMKKVEELISGGEPADAKPEAKPVDAAPAPDAPAPVAMRVDFDELVTLRAFRAAAEGKERRALVAALVKHGEPPATAWSDSTATAPAEPWASMGLEALRVRVAKLDARPVGDAARPPAVGAAGLSEERLAICREYALDPNDYAAMLARAGRA